MIASDMNPAEQHDSKTPRNTYQSHHTLSKCPRNARNNSKNTQNTHRQMNSTINNPLRAVFPPSSARSEHLLPRPSPSLPNPQPLRRTSLLRGRAWVSAWVPCTSVGRVKRRVTHAKKSTAVGDTLPGWGGVHGGRAAATSIEDRVRGERVVGRDGLISLLLHAPPPPKKKIIFVLAQHVELDRDRFKVHIILFSISVCDGVCHHGYTRIHEQIFTVFCKPWARSTHLLPFLLYMHGTPLVVHRVHGLIPSPSQRLPLFSRS